MSPFYNRLPNVPGFGADTSAETIGLTAIGAVTALSAAHGVGKAVQARRHREAPLPSQAGEGPADESALKGGRSGQWSHFGMEERSTRETRGTGDEDQN